MNKNIVDIVKNLTSRPKEEEWFEFKENRYQPNEIGEYISALSNSAVMKGQEDGYLIWGVNDGNHELINTSFEYHVDVDGEPLEHYLARNISPDVNFEFVEDIIDGNRLVVLIIPAAKTVPTLFKGERYIRIGSSKVKLSKYPEHEAALFNILNNGQATIENTESKYQELTFKQLFVYYGIKGITLKENTFKKNLGLLTEDGKYNVMAQLLSDNPHIPIRFSLFNGKTKAATMYAVREFGNICLLMALNRVLDYGAVLNVLQADERNRVVERKEIMLLNLERILLL